MVKLIRRLYRWLINHPLLTILVLASVLRLVALDKVPPSLNWDEVSMGYSAYSIIKTGRDEWGEKLPLFFRSYGEWKSAVYIYLLVPFIKLLGLNAWAVRLPTSLAGIFAVYLTYLITKQIFDRRSALWAAFFLAVSPWHMMLSRPAFEASLSLTLILAGIYFFLNSQSSVTSRSAKNSVLSFWNWSLVASAVFFGLAPHTYNSAKVVTPFLVLWLVYVFRKKFRVKHLVVFFTILAIFAYPIAENLLTGKSQKRYEQVGVTTDLNLITEFYGFRHTFPLPLTINKFIFNKYTLFTYKTVDNWLSYFSPAFLLSSGGGHTQHQIPYRGVLYLTEFAAFLVGLWSFFHRRRRPAITYLPLVIIGLGFLPPAMTRETHHVLRSILALPGWQMLAGLGVVYLQKKKSPKFLNFYYLLLAIEVISFISLYFTWYPRAFAQDWQYGYKEAIEFAEAHRQEYPKVVMTKWYGEPQVFVAFYTKWDPQDFQKKNIHLLRYETEGKIWLDQLETYSLGRYTFKYINWYTEDKNKQTLYIGKADDFPFGAKILKTIYFPNGKVAFHLAVVK